MISLLSVLSTPENTHGCCDGYEWNAVKKDCAGMSIASVILNQKKQGQCFPLFQILTNILTITKPFFTL